jgi:ATP-dependent helicase/nuclease subunit A
MRARIVAHLKERNRSERLVKNVETTSNIGTIHSFCYGLLDSYGSVIGLPPVRGILTGFELANGYEAAYAEWLEALDPQRLRSLLGSFSHRELKEMASHLFRERFVFRRAVALTENECPALTVLHESLEPLVANLEKSFNERGLYSFDDLENLALRILEESPDTAARLRGELKHLLVDEFQDTSLLQWKILKHLTGEETAKLFVVGDPKQSIYSFRHADVKLFLRVTSEIAASGGLLQELSANFRSEPGLLRAINGLSASFFSGAEVPFSAMRAGREETAPPERCPLLVRRYEGGGGKGELYRAEIREVVTAAREILERGEPPESLAILFRVSDRIPEYYQALSRARIPARCKRTTRLFDCYDVVDLGNYLKVVENPLDSFALAGFLRSSFVGLKERRLAEAMDAPGETLYEKLLPLDLPEVRWLFALIESGEFRAREALATLFAKTTYFPRQRDAVMEWLAPMAENEWTVSEAVAKLAAWESEESLFGIEEGGHGVNLMTVHAAKGLEYAHVFLVDNLRVHPKRSPALRLHPEFPVGLRYRVEGEPATSESYERLAERQAQGDLEESKRILYVALTRAEETLTLFLPGPDETVPRGTWAAMLEDALRIPKDPGPGPRHAIQRNDSVPVSVPGLSGPSK